MPATVSSSATAAAASQPARCAGPTGEQRRAARPRAARRHRPDRRPGWRRATRRRPRRRAPSAIASTTSSYSSSGHCARAGTRCSTSPSRTPCGSSACAVASNAPSVRRSTQPPCCSPSSASPSPACRSTSGSSSARGTCSGRATSTRRCGALMVTRASPVVIDWSPYRAGIGGCADDRTLPTMSQARVTERCQEAECPPSSSSGRRADRRRRSRPASWRSTRRRRSPWSTGGRWQQLLMVLPMLGGTVAMAMMFGRGGGRLLVRGRRHVRPLLAGDAGDLLGQRLRHPEEVRDDGRPPGVPAPPGRAAAPGPADRRAAAGRALLPAPRPGPALVDGGQPPGLGAAPRRPRLRRGPGRGRAADAGHPAGPAGHPAAGGAGADDRRRAAPLPRRVLGGAGPAGGAVAAQLRPGHVRPRPGRTTPATGGRTGDPAAQALARAMLAQLAVFHAPDDLLVAVCAGPGAPGRAGSG